jgi:hypothetical protein
MSLDSAPMLDAYEYEYEDRANEYEYDDRLTKAMPLIHPTFIKSVRQHRDGSATLTLSRPYINRVTNRRRLTVHIPADLNEAWDEEFWPGMSMEIAFNSNYRVLDMREIDDDYVPAV